jgi:hypothetical protein
VKFEITRPCQFSYKDKIFKGTEPGQFFQNKKSNYMELINWWLFKNQRSTQHFLHYIIVVDDTITGIRVFKRAFIAWFWYESPSLIFGWYVTSIYICIYLIFETNIALILNWYYLKSRPGKYSYEAGIVSSTLVWLVLWYQYYSIYQGSSLLGTRPTLVWSSVVWIYLLPTYTHWV